MLPSPVYTPGNYLSFMPPKKNTAASCECCPPTGGFCMEIGSDGKIKAPRRRKVQKPKVVDTPAVEPEAEKKPEKDTKASDASKVKANTTSSSSESHTSSSSSSESDTSSSSFQEERKPLKPKQVKPDICNDASCQDPKCALPFGISSAHEKVPSPTERVCTNVNCPDSNCSVHFEDVPAQESRLASSERRVCTDSNCKDPNCGKDTTLRNTFLGLAGVLIFMMFSYMAFIKLRTRRVKTPAASKLSEEAFSI